MDDTKCSRIEALSYINAFNKKKLKVYCDCALMLQASLDIYNLQYRVVTGHASYSWIRQNYPSINTIQCQEHYFNNNFTRFSEAHGKFDMYNLIGNELDDNCLYVCLDTDVVCLADPMILLRSNPPASNDLLVYNIIENQILSYGIDALRKDLSLGEDKDVLQYWCGGEFIAGKATAFRSLSSYISKNWDVYESERDGIRHLGDENLLSRFALTTNGLSIINSQACQRLWTKTRVPGLGSSIGENVVFLHCPDSKGLLQILSSFPEILRKRKFIHQVLLKYLLKIKSIVFRIKNYGL